MGHQRKYEDKNDVIQRRKDRRALIWRMSESQAFIQSKRGPEIASPDDEHEREADEVARKVMSSGNAKMTESNTASKVQRKDDEEESHLMAKSESGGLHGTEELQVELDSSKGSGKTLDESTRNEMEQKMGADLGDVRIHTGSHAHEMAEGINAKAFTHDQDIYFKQGNFDPFSDQGKELLAHELAHTQQQKNGVGRKVQRRPDGDITDNGPTEHAKGKFDSKTHIYTVPTKSVYRDPKKAYDTLYSIAARFNVTVTALKTENGLTDGNLKPGTQLRIPVPPAPEIHKDKVPEVIPAEQKSKEEKKIKENMGSTVTEGVTYVNKTFEYNEGVWYAFDYYEHSKTDDDFKSKWQDSWWYGHTDSDKWSKPNNAMTFTLKPGVKASEAIQEWLKGLTIAECYSTTVAIELNALRIEIGDKKFDELYSSFYGPPKKSLLVISNIPVRNTQWESVVKYEIINEDDLEPGDFGYVYNHPKYLLKHPAGVFQGENAVYMGNEEWSGLGMHPQKIDEMLSAMAGAYNQKRTPRDYWKILTIMADSNLKSTGGVKEITWNDSNGPTYEYTPALESKYEEIYAKYHKKHMVPKEYDEDYVSNTKSGKKNKHTVDADYFIPRNIKGKDILEAPAYTLPYPFGGSPRKGGLSQTVKHADPEKVSDLKNQ